MDVITSSPKLIRNVRRSPAAAQALAVDIRPFDEPASDLLLVSNWDGDLRMEHWVEQNRETQDKALNQAGALLFRGFTVASANEFSRIAAQLCGELHEDYGDLPRSQAGDRIYQPTVYPTHEPILLHNEGAHLPAWPERMCFHCQVPANAGGETTLLDTRKMWDSLDTGLRDALEKEGMAYVRNFHAHVDQPWQAVFRTQDPVKVEALCHHAGIEFHWTGNGSLRTSYTVPARATHPVTGESLFFHQLLLFHPACLPTEVRQSLDCLYDFADLPRNVTLGNGAPIPDEPVRRFKESCEKLEVAVPWQAGDILLVDNMRYSHGRRPYQGDRKILVGMGGMCARNP